MPIRLSGIGVVQPWQTVTVRSRGDGQLLAVGFQEGDVVQQGQLLAQLDDRAPQAQLAQAIAQQRRSQVQLDNARQDLKRYTELARHGAIERQVLDAQQAQVAVLQATVQADQAQVQAAQVQVDDARITAPLTGRTGALLVDVGNQVRAADAQGLVVINQVDPVAVSFTVPDTAYDQVRAALATPSAAEIPVQVRAQGQPRLLGQGALVLVDNQIDDSSATLRLKARLDNPDLALWPGQTVDVRLILGEHAGALVVPDAAVQRGADGLFVYVVGADDRVRLQPVRVALSQDGRSLISQGVAAGDRVVVDGQYRLKPGALVAEIRDAEAPADAPPAVPPAAVQGAEADQAAAGRAASPAS
ncbi:efflux RND transporter periplasmic adaptor subunit [Castellaniella hirudinis]|uniref:efflux RND transporter periplasmic adaptor subunit n=1 Tax=Castellaniella hirudinis TaxID=1144617 RepID=UPI0039C35567